MVQKNFRNILLGLGLDGRDGHTRITRGKNFYLFGGSKLTHEDMREKAVKFNEELSRQGKSLDGINKKEFFDIAGKIGLEIPKENPKQKS